MTKLRLDVKLNFLIKKKNKTKKIMIKHYHLHGINKTMVASQGRFELIEPNKLIILIEETIKKNVINFYMKCNNIPELWIIYFLKMANNRECVYNFCKRPFNDSHRPGGEW